MRPNEIIALLNSLERNPEQLTRRHLKKIYALLIASGHYPVCPWCHEYIYNIDDFTWDHIVPKSAGGPDTLENLQPMHKHCNNASKRDDVYQAEYHYDIKSDLADTIMSVRVTSIPKKQKSSDAKQKQKQKYNNSKRRTKTKTRQR